MRLTVLDHCYRAKKSLTKGAAGTDLEGARLGHTQSGFLSRGFKACTYIQDSRARASPTPPHGLHVSDSLPQPPIRVWGKHVSPQSPNVAGMMEPTSGNNMEQPLVFYINTNIMNQLGQQWHPRNTSMEKIVVLKR